MVRNHCNSGKLYFKRIIFGTTFTLELIAIEMTTKETTDIFAISFGWSTILKYLYYADIYNISALTNQKLTTAILQAIGDESNKNDNEERKITMKSTKLSQYADKALISAFNKYLIRFGLKPKRFVEEVYKINGVFAGGFVLSIYSGNLSVDSDIDIFVPKQKKGAKFQLEMVRVKSLIYYIVDHCNYVYMTNQKDHKYSNFSVITFINKLLNKKIQMIMTYYCENISSYPFTVIDNFDLTICMCFIQVIGKQTVVFHSKYKSHIFDKTMQVNKLKPFTIQFALKTIGRIIKYQEKGYKFLNGKLNLEQFWQYEIGLTKSKRK